MKRIASFSVNHDVLDKGMYISRKDGDVITYDVRMKKPNNPENDYISPAGAHTIEHLMATYMRNSDYTDSIIYVGPMGCQTGFYFLTRDDVPEETAIKLVQDSLVFIRDFEGEMPGGKRIECGQYLLHDIPDAKKIAADMIEVLKDWSPEKLIYPTA
ncbi:MAG: S-ribosylhomocysteine lyase [Oscillospiraceae bacterium]|nr:S-ribosylhomocysteine lyase [Oscillospiraceae bacterium]